MNGAQSGSGSSGHVPKLDDIDGVLGRFQNWANARQEKPNGVGTKAATAWPPLPEKTKLAGEARELSYDQALQATRHRRILAESPPPAAASGPALSDPDAPEAPRKTRAAAAKTSETKEATFRSAGVASPEPPVTGTRASTRAARTSAVAKTATPTAKPERVARKKAAANSVPSPKTKTSAPRIGSRPAVASRVSASASLHPELAPPSRSVKPKPAAARNRLPASRAKMVDPLTASFAKFTLLEEEMYAAPKSQLQEVERAKALVRMAEANLSISAYLRQCALGDDFRLGSVMGHPQFLTFLERSAREFDHRQNSLIATNSAAYPPSSPPTRLSTIFRKLWDFGVKRWRSRDNDFSSLSLR